MFRSLRLVVFCVAAALQTASSGSANAQDVNAAVEVVRQFIAAHMTHLDTMQGPLLNDARAAAPYVVDALAVDGLQGRLGFDPIYNAQDFEITNLRVYADPRTPILRGAAQVRVTLDNFGARQEFVYALVQVAPDNAWQISDIYSVNNDWSLANMAADLGIDLRRQTGPEVTLDSAGIPIPCAFACGNPTEPGAQESQAPIVVPEPVVVPGMEEGDLPGNGINPDGRNLLVILDASGSMWGQVEGEAKIATAREALTGIMGDLDPATNVGLMAYGHRRKGDCGDTEVLYPVSNYAPGQLIPAIEGISPLGKTPIAGALKQAASAMPASGQSSSVLLISDGLETCGGDPCAAAARLAEAGIDTRVHVVGFDLSAQEHAALQCIAENGNGTYYPANDARSFVAAVNEAVREAAHATPAPAPQPAPSSNAETVFEDTFDGPVLHPDWRVENPVEELMAFTPEGQLFLAALGKEPHFRKPEATNRLILDRPVPKGDFDFVVDFKIDVQTKRELMMLSLFGAAHEQIGAYVWLEPTGCGTQFRFSLIRISGTEDDPQTTSFDTNLLDGPWADNMCGATGRAQGDAILKALGQNGARLALKRRGREMTGSIQLQMPGGGETLSYTTEAISVLRLSGAPSLLGGHGHKAVPGESHFEIDRFAIEVPPQ
ncbi:VWA domain-containing protein [Nitratireductor sp. GISD-1A_MAKvit]|uniref:vWA domain-containing protein n=1 Tax=Nitratireductor sp. GISD-1A_MAKvit TaxID=3234198 RepID=UPI0034672222